MSYVEMLRKAYERWHESRGQSVGEWLALMADDITLRSLADGAGPMAFSAPRRGRAAVAQYFVGLAEDWETLYYRVDEFVEQGDRVVMIGQGAWRNRSTGKEVESPLVSVWRFRDGQATEYFEFYDTARAFAAAGPG